MRGSDGPRHPRLPERIGPGQTAHPFGGPVRQMHRKRQPFIAPVRKVSRSRSCRDHYVAICFCVTKKRQEYWTPSAAALSSTSRRPKGRLLAVPDLPKIFDDISTEDGILKSTTPTDEIRNCLNVDATPEMLAAKSSFGRPQTCQPRALRCYLTAKQIATSTEPANLRTENVAARRRLIPEADLPKSRGSDATNAGPSVPVQRALTIDV